MHRATPYDPFTQRRVVRRCTVLGEAPVGKISERWLIWRFSRTLARWLLDIDASVPTQGGSWKCSK